MMVFAIVLAVLAIASLVAWNRYRNALWGAVSGVLVLAAVTAFGWIAAGFWIVATVMLLVGIVVAVTLSSRVGRRILSIAAGGALVIGAIGLGIAGVGALVGAFSHNGTAAQAATDEVLETDEATESDTLAFDPSVDLLPAAAVCKTDDFLDHSSNRVINKKHLKFATAVSTPIKGKTAKDVRQELMDENCGNPTFLAMNLNDLSKWKQISNKGWITEARKFVSAGLNDPTKIISKDAEGNLHVSAAYQKYASWMNSFLLRANVSKAPESLPSIRNWEVSVGVAPATLPNTQLAKKQESKPAWTFSFNNKLGCQVKIGYNTLDKRLELFSCNKPKPKPPVEQPPIVEPPVCTTDCVVTPPPPPVCETDCTPPPPECEVDCTPPPPPPTCPPGQNLNDNGVCVTPKSDNEDDYKHDEDKQQVTDDGNHQTVPDDVVTTETGNDNIVDTPTNDPGSETGTNAPGTDTKKDDKPVVREVNKNEGGNEDTNTTDVGGF